MRALRGRPCGVSVELRYLNAALDYMQEFGLSKETVRSVLASPERCLPSVTSTGEEARVFTRGDVEVVLGLACAAEGELWVLNVRRIDRHTNPHAHRGVGGAGPGSNAPTTMKELVRRAALLGLRRVVGSNHDYLADSEGNRIITISGTPSDHRALKNSWARIQAWARDAGVTE